MSFLGEEAGAFKYSILSFADVMPASAQGGVTLEPFLLQVIERNRVHVATKLIAEAAGGDKVFKPLSFVATRDDMLSGGSIAGNKRKVAKRNFHHVMSAVATSVVLRLRKKTNISHSLTPCKSALSLL